jgi:uncharacterized protein involved in exopolysaccharide biosynthesis
MRLFAFLQRKPKKDEPVEPAVVPEPPTDLTQYFLSFLWRRKFIIAMVTIMGIALTGFGTYLCTPLNHARTKILVGSSEPEDIILFDGARRPMLKRGMNIIPANNIIELATSEAVAREIVYEFKLDEEIKRKIDSPEGLREEFWALLFNMKNAVKSAVKFPYVFYKTKIKGLPVKISPPDYRRAAVRNFMSDVAEIELVADSDVVSLSVWWIEPEAAEAMAIRLTDLVIEQFVQLERSAASSGYEFCSDELRKAGVELTIAQANLQDFKKEFNISHLERQKEVQIAALHEVERSLVSTKAQLAALRARLTEEEQKIDRGREKFSSPGSYQDLLDEMRTRSFEITASHAKQQEYEAAWDRIKFELATLTSKEPELRNLEIDVELKEKLFVLLGQKQEQLAVQRVSKLSGLNIRIIDTPELSANTSADYPDWTLNMALGVGGSILVAIGIALLVHLSKEPFWFVAPEAEVKTPEE